MMYRLTYRGKPASQRRILWERVDALEVAPVHVGIMPVLRRAARMTSRIPAIPYQLERGCLYPKLTAPPIRRGEHVRLSGHTQTI